MFQVLGPVPAPVPRPALGTHTAGSSGLLRVLCADLSCPLRKCPIATPVPAVAPGPSKPLPASNSPISVIFFASSVTSVICPTRRFGRPKATHARARARAAARARARAIAWARELAAARVPGDGGQHLARGKPAPRGGGRAKRRGGGGEPAHRGRESKGDDEGSAHAEELFELVGGDLG
jgi:hypothetical protein